MKLSSKNLVIIAGIGVLLLVSLGIFLWQQGRSTGGNEPGGNQALPTYTLSREEEEGVAKFVQMFISLYNSYSYEDLTNLTALGDFQTVEMQEKTYLLVSQLEENIPEGYEKSTIPDLTSFLYTYSEANTLQVTMGAAVTESGAGTYPASARLTLVRSGMNWYVDSFELTRQ